MLQGAANFGGWDHHTPQHHHPAHRFHGVRTDIAGAGMKIRAMLSCEFRSPSF